MEPQCDWGTKVCSNDPGHVTTISIQKSSKPASWWHSNLVYSIRDFIQMMSLGWPWPTLQQGQLCSLLLLYGKMLNTRFYRDCFLLCSNNPGHVTKMAAMPYMLKDPVKIRFILSNICTQAAGHIKVRFHVEPLWLGEWKIVQMM